MLVIGLTGSVAMGKTTVAGMFAEQYVRVLERNEAGDEGGDA